MKSCSQFSLVLERFLNSRPLVFYTTGLQDEIPLTPNRIPSGQLKGNFAASAIYENDEESDGEG